MEIQQLLEQRESEWLDFKRQYHDNMGKLLHDILCLANAYSEHDRYLVFGISDDRSLHDISGDRNRKTNANLEDFLRGANLNRTPTCRIDTHVINEKTLDVLTIRNRPDKPFFLTKDYGRGDQRVRNGVIYTRNGDTNIPMMESAADDKVELMWRERFGLGLSPLERAKRLLGEPKRWTTMSGGYLYCTDFPEFTIRDGKTMTKEFKEDWTEVFSDKSAHSFEVLLRYHSTVLARFTFVECDGCRYRVPLPKRVKKANGDSGYVISRSSPAWKLALLYKQYGDLSKDLSGVVELIE